MEIMTATKTTNVKIPKNWIKTDDGRFKARIPYREEMGSINPDSIPDCVNFMQDFKNVLVMWSDTCPVISDGACLIFIK